MRNEKTVTMHDKTMHWVRACYKTHQKAIWIWIGERGWNIQRSQHLAEVVNLPDVWAWLVVKTSSHHKQVQYWRNLSPSNQLKTGINHHQLSMWSGDATGACTGWRSLNQHFWKLQYSLNMVKLWAYLHPLYNHSRWHPHKLAWMWPFSSTILADSTLPQYRTYSRTQ